MAEQSTSIAPGVALIVQALQGSRLGVLITDQAGTISYANPALCLDSGYAADELIGATPNRFSSGRHSAAFWAQLWQTVAAGDVWRGEFVNRRKDGTLVCVAAEIAPVLSPRGGPPTGYLALLQALPGAEPQRTLAPSQTSDPLTGLPGALAFDRVVGESLQRAQLLQHMLTLATLDVDRFGPLNASLGQFAGDQVLREVALRIQAAIRPDDLVARLRDDCFGVLLLGDPADHGVLDRIVAALREPIALGGHAVQVTASIGAADFPHDGQTGAELMDGASAALALAKQQGRDTVRRFERASASARVFSRRDMLAQMRDVTERNELVLHYQPQLSLHSGEIVGTEALLRWAHPVHGLVAPGQFIPLAEESGQIIPISEWVLHTACRQAVAWQVAGLQPLRMAVNLSARHFRYLDLADTVAQVLRDCALEARYLELEITENVMMHDTAAAARTIVELKALGVRLSLDDFGTGHSSLAYLSRFAIDVLKIDQSFIRDITTNEINASIVAATIAMGHKLGKSIIAEGVETGGQMHALRRLECDEMQGFLFSRALPAAELETLLVRGDRLDLQGDPAHALSNKRLLLVDDEPNILNALRRLLRREGYEVFVASGGAAGLELLASEPVQVIVSDQRMPGMSGTEFLGKVKSMYPDTVRLVLSGYADLESVTEAVNQGAIYKYLAKPWDDEALKGELRAAFRHHRSKSGKDE